MKQVLIFSALALSIFGCGNDTKYATKEDVETAQTAATAKNSYCPVAQVVTYNNREGWAVATARMTEDGVYLAHAGQFKLKELCGNDTKYVSLASSQESKEPNWVIVKEYTVNINTLKSSEEYYSKNVWNCYQRCN